MRLGGVYASLALALVLIYRAMDVANFAQGEMAMFSTFIAYTLITSFHLPFSWSSRSPSSSPSRAACSSSA